MKKQQKVDFNHFLEKFPELELPVTLSEESQLEFSRQNEPLPPLMVAQFILPLEEEQPDELTEYIACFRLPETHVFHALVYWRGALLDYQYILVTFTKEGRPIDKRPIAGTFSDGRSLTRTITTIDEDWEILMVSGHLATEKQVYKASSTTTKRLELLPDGRIVNI